MAGSTFIQIPSDLSDYTTMRRFLEKLVQQLDIAFGNRGTSGFSSVSTVVDLNNLVTNIESSLNSKISTALQGYSRLDGTREYSGIVSYDASKVFTLPEELISKSYVDTNFTNNPIQANIPLLEQTISLMYTQSELQDISDKVDSIIEGLVASNIIEPVV